MLITKMHAKIHRANVTGADLNYEGSIAIDTNLLLACGMSINELSFEEKVLIKNHP